MDLLTLGIGFFLGVIVYTIVIYIMVRRIKKKRLLNKNEGGLNNHGTINFTDKNNTNHK